MLVIQVGKMTHSYIPKSDFLVMKFDLPRLAMEADLHSDRYPVYYIRLMVQAASIVRFANTLDTYKKEKDFVFVAIFIFRAGVVRRTLLYQNRNKDGDKVYWKRRTFDLAKTQESFRFARELYNFSSELHARIEEEDTDSQVEKLKRSVQQFMADYYNLPAFTIKTKHPASNHEEDRSESNSRPRAKDDAPVEQLEASGYKVVPTVFETDGGTWELISKPPPNIRIVYRRRDQNKTELIAKHIRKGSQEPAIHEFLHTRRPRSQHVIPFIEAIPATNPEWLILPKLHSIHKQQLMNLAGVGGRVQLGWGLIKGLAYLHDHKIAHRDIKPDNLVCDDDFTLQIIDFDLAIEVEDENTEIDEYGGTEEWTAPEVEKKTD
ncbi:kinase-like domain-containing protein [Lactarius quietus]|nr:kinase-like domain-containing protein [Lactarius quietus]